MQSERIFFDLNTYHVHNSWDVPKAIREFIANALDEQLLTSTPDIQIDYNSSTQTVIIQDFGRGLRLEHLVQDQNEEKNHSKSVTMGKFGYGLKDAIAYLFNQNMPVSIYSKFLGLTPIIGAKNGTSISTIHMTGYLISYLAQGTRIEIPRVSLEQLEQAKKYFIRFNNYQQISSTKYGSVYRKWPGERSKIFISGQMITEDSNYNYHYDIIPTKKIRDSLSRERNSLNRGIYSTRITDIIKLSSGNSEIQEWLIANCRRKDGEFGRNEIRQLARQLSGSPASEYTFTVDPVVTERYSSSINGINSKISRLVSNFPTVVISPDLQDNQQPCPAAIVNDMIVIRHDSFNDNETEYIGLYLKQLAKYNDISVKEIIGYVALLVI